MELRDAEGLQKRGRQVEVYLMLEDSVLQLAGVPAITNMLAVGAVPLLPRAQPADDPRARAVQPRSLLERTCILILIFLLSMFLGMREVSAALSNPFGDDDVDLPVGKMIRDLRKLISPLVQETLESRLMPPHSPRPLPTTPSRRGCRRRRRARAADGLVKRCVRAGGRATRRARRVHSANAGGAYSSCPARRWGPRRRPPLYVAATQAGPVAASTASTCEGPST